MIIISIKTCFSGENNVKRVTILQHFVAQIQQKRVDYMAKNTENKIVENAIVDLFGRDLIDLLDQKKIKQSVALMKSLKIKKDGRRRLIDEHKKINNSRVK